MSDELRDLIESYSGDVPTTAIDAIFERLKLASEGYITEEEVGLYRQMLSNRDSNDRYINKSEGVLVDRQTEIAEKMIKIKAGLLGEYGDKYGHELINKFFQEFSPDRIIVVTDKEYPKILISLTDWFSLSQTEDRKEHYSGGAYEAYSGLIVISESMFDEATLTEEIIHALLFHNRYDETDTRIRSLVELKISNLRIINELIDSRGLENIDWDGLYYSDPEDQVAKALTKGVLENLNSHISFNNFELEAARMGEIRIGEIGWERVRSGELETDHEEDFEVSAKKQSERQRRERMAMRVDYIVSTN